MKLVKLLNEANQYIYNIGYLIIDKLNGSVETIKVEYKINGEKNEYRKACIKQGVYISVVLLSLIFVPLVVIH